MLEAMGSFNEELAEAGILLAAEVLAPSSRNKRVAFDEPGRTVIDGPFANPRELVAGFWFWDGRGGLLGEALPQSHAGPERDPAAVRDGRFAPGIRRGGGRGNP